MKRKHEHDTSQQTISNEMSESPDNNSDNSTNSADPMSESEAFSLSASPDRTVELFDSLENPVNFTGNKETRNNKLAGKYTIYTLNTLPELLQEIRKSACKKDIKLRYLLTPQFELLFAREGRPNSWIPAHFAMTGCTEIEAKCITAGNIKINDRNEIVFISNRSGDFKPSWGSLQYALFALLACDANFANEFEVMNSTTCEPTKNIRLDSLKNEIDSRFTETDREKCKEINRTSVNRIHEYAPKEARNTFFTNKPKYSEDRVSENLFEESPVKEARNAFFTNKSKGSGSRFSEKLVVIPFELS